MDPFLTQLAAGTGALNGTPFEVIKFGLSCFQTGTALGGADVISLQYSPDGGTTFIAVLPAVQFSLAINSVTISAPGIYRWSRGAIATSTGVGAYAFQNR